MVARRAAIGGAILFGFGLMAGLGEVGPRRARTGEEDGDCPTVRVGDLAFNCGLPGAATGLGFDLGFGLVSVGGGFFVLGCGVGDSAELTGVVGERGGEVALEGLLASPAVEGLDLSLLVPVSVTF